MKKILLSLSFVFLAIYTLKANAFVSFPQAIKTCEKYSNNGAITQKGETFNILITLDKAKNKCTYKEKIYQGNDYQMLTCKFTQDQQEFISKSMLKFNQTFAKEIAKNNIFEAKLTTNAEVFQKYLANPEICQITHSKK